MRTGVAGAMVVMALTGCAPAPTITPAEARALISDLGRGDGDADLCTPEGRLRFRAAVRVHSAEMGRRGEAWPDIPDLMSGDHEPDMAELTVMGAVLSGWVKPSDLTGRAREMGGLLSLSMALHPDLGKTRRGLDVACRDVMELQRLMAVQQVEAKAFERRVEAAHQDGDRERVRELGERMELRTRYMMREMERLTTSIEAKVAAAR